MKGLHCSLALCLGLLTAVPAFGQDAKVTVNGAQPGPVLAPEIQGQFAEHLGRLIYEGIWVGEKSSIPNIRGYRKDVVEALKAIRVPLIRWPGGCFADEYHWRDGIGPRAKRPVGVNTNWGGVAETNEFGTHEFMDFSELVGAKTYVNGNIGTGSAREMADWVEYMTNPSKSTLAQTRRANGRDKPWTLDWFAIGNETWGCGGNMRPEFYTDQLRQIRTFIKPAAGQPTKIIASGGNSDDLKWTDVVMAGSANMIDAISLHHYALPSFGRPTRGTWKDKGSATEFGESDWFALMVTATQMDDLLTKHSAVMDKYDPKKKVALVVDEWGNWFDPTPGTNPGFLEQQNTLRDAVTAAINLNIFHKHGERVRMANIAQMVNVLQALILTDGPKMLLTPTYHVFDMYKDFQGATQFPVTVAGPKYSYAERSLPAISASAARAKDGSVLVALTNINPNEAVPVTVSLDGVTAAGVSGRILTAPAMNAHNSFAQPDAVKPVAFTGAALNGTTLSVTLPAKSVVVLVVK
ncbi:alpha-N-arabinofuranosidase [Niveispirillum cyanobacteriorum]|uniref:non-reducing end alpha-L-arabinofuranosidase n=1 Tax=Niveispirillum cyanobacteriorum TaxID=1612173 RepID=A0A2K9NJH0_9PROT|nr:alpha-L-arabinofuranosidase C-terminal domain-containing protein [Niveispirillum cyanobacteriorum]AUN33213.1 alpha-N-arabinofuranosidase [Niveispirillum cyanobacteriorum]GGE50721.1 alpha-L-arabinofuranosidase [Niveispirillum cyanobacteriorum]